MITLPCRVQHDAPSGRYYIVDAADNTIAWVFNESRENADALVAGVNRRRGKGHDNLGRPFCLGSGTAAAEQATAGYNGRRRFRCPVCFRRASLTRKGVLRAHIPANVATPSPLNA